MTPVPPLPLPPPAPKFIKMFVLDEADEMLSRGFKDQIYDIFQKLSGNTQVGGTRGGPGGAGGDPRDPPPKKKHQKIP